MKVWNGFGVLLKCAVCSHEVGLDGLLHFMIRIGLLCSPTPWFCGWKMWCSLKFRVIKAKGAYGGNFRRLVLTP